MSISDLEKKKDLWLVAVPIVNLRLTEKVKNEFRINRVTFINTKKFQRIQKRLRLHRPLSKIKNFPRANEILETNPVFAYLYMNGSICDFKNKVYKIINDELAILSSSLLGFKKRSSFIAPRIKGFNVSQLQNNLFISRKTNSFLFSSSIRDMTKSLNLNNFWIDSVKEKFFLRALKIIRGETKVSNSWKKTLTRALILIGKSQTTRSIADAFLWNMIAMEMLTTVRGDKYSVVLPERLESLLGWVGHWNDYNYMKAIEVLYQKRCQYVHTGNSDSITISDLIFSDEILCNLVNNVIRHYKIFESKEKVIDFAQKVKAEHILGIKSKTRPKTLKYYRLVYTEKDFGKDI